MKNFLYTTNIPAKRKEIGDYLTYLDAKHKGKEVHYMVEIKMNKPIRSVSANSYYWVVITAIANEIGEIKERVHQWYALEYLGEEFQGKMIARSTTDLDSMEFKIYVEKVKQHAREFHEIGYIPEPADKTYAVWEKMTKDRYDAIFASL